jgi:hypothetical protein
MKWSDLSRLAPRTRDMVMRLEWRANDNDCQGQRCPVCGATQSSGKHDRHCDLGALCDDIRIVERAREIVG